MGRLSKKQNKIVNQIIAAYKNSNKKDIVIVCIGTSKLIGDCLGPLIGTRLLENKTLFNIIGNLSENVHALNIVQKVEEINKIYDDPFIIGIDACVSNDDEVGDCIFKKDGINPGRGVEKNLGMVGDCGIVGIVYKYEEYDYDEIYFQLRNAQLINHIYPLSTNILNILLSLNKKIKLKKLIGVV